MPLFRRGRQESLQHIVFICHIVLFVCSLLFISGFFLQFQCRNNNPQYFASSPVFRYFNVEVEVRNSSQARFGSVHITIIQLIMQTILIYIYIYTYIYIYIYTYIYIYIYAHISCLSQVPLSAWQLRAYEEIKAKTLRRLDAYCDVIHDHMI